MKQFLLVLFIVSTLPGFASPGDTTLIQTFTFNDLTRRRDLFNFPDDNRTWEKIIMIRTLKCDEQTTADIYPCGEWDYSTSTFVYVPKGDTTELFELEGFVTPYGKRLELGGEAGWSFHYDVTDYAPLLKGAVDLSSGNKQELLDMKFLFIEGTPPRKVLSIENIYPFGQYNYQKLADDEVLKPTKLHFSPLGQGFKLKARISGHGHFGPRNCCEWDAKTHTYYGNGEVLFRWMVWKDCGLNPIFPQGGTWQFNRAGWCPGTPVDTYEFELTGKLFPGDSLEMDYGIEMYRDNGEKGGNYRMSHQLVTYGEPNFTNDAAVVDIMAPTSKDLYSRLNPIINNPAIIIENTGQHLLQSLKITYGIAGRETYEYLWSGRLPFLQKTTVVLPAINWQGIKNNDTFRVSIASANGTTDQYQPNNSMDSKVVMPAVLPPAFQLYIRANGLNRAREMAYTLCDSRGAVLYERQDFEDDVIYMDPLSLDKGFYELRITDAAEDGLIRHWWNRGRNPERIGRDGRIAIMDMQGELLHELKSDFAEEIIFRFEVQN
jgi:hypothetical protein